MLQWRNKTVICYFNLGAVQPQDCDFNETWYDPELWTGKFYGPANINSSAEDWYCERYVDLNDDKVMDALKSRIGLAANVGCDGVDPDNIDIYNVDSLGMDKTTVITKLKELVKFAKTQTTKRHNPLMFGQKNAKEIGVNMTTVMDFAVLERCLGKENPTDPDDAPFCNTFKKYYLDLKKPVVDIEYPPTLRDEENPPSFCRKTGYDIAVDGRVCTTDTIFPAEYEQSPQAGP